MDVVAITLKQLEQSFEDYFVRGTESYIAAWEILDSIRVSGMWSTAMLSDGSTPSSFEGYMMDLTDKLLDKYPQLPIRRSTAFYNLRWLRRANALGLPTDNVLHAPPSVMNKISNVSEWDSDTGELLSVDSSLIDVSKLPEGKDSDIDRFKDLISAVVYSRPKDAHILMDEVMLDYSDEFVYTIVVSSDRVTTMRVRFTRYVNGVVKDVKWYDLINGTDTLPKEVIDNLCTKLGASPVDVV